MKTRRISVVAAALASVAAAATLFAQIPLVRNAP